MSHIFKQSDSKDAIGGRGRGMSHMFIHFASMHVVLSLRMQPGGGGGEVEINVPMTLGVFRDGKGGGGVGGVGGLVVVVDHI